MTYYEKHRAIKEGRASSYNFNNDNDSCADSIFDVIEWIANPLNKIRAKIVGASIELTGKTYEFKEDFKRFLYAKWNPQNKSWVCSNPEVVECMTINLEGVIK